MAWAEGEKPRRQTISLYGDLFATKHQLQSEETAKPQELVWGPGVSSWKLLYAERTRWTVVDFQYPLLTQAVELALEEKTLAIEVRPRAVDPRFELDAFSACQISGTVEVEKAAGKRWPGAPTARSIPLTQGSFEHLLKLIAGNLHEKGRFTPGAHTFPPADEDLVVSDAWVLLARPRSNNYLHEDIERLKARIKAGADIPSGPLALVTPPSDETVTYEPVHFRGLSGGSGGGDRNEVKELYFPLPYNHEQVTIVEQLERSTGVAVQGPPGTGKTHTIANIICHYLATGKKVLVTSKGEPALEVLQSKIPEAVRPLTVALLSGDREGMRQFQTSIEAIIHNVSQLNVDVVREQIQTDQTTIDRVHAELAVLDGRVNEIALSHLSNLEVDGAEMNARRMAELVVSGAERHSWFDDPYRSDVNHAPPFGEAEAASLRESRRRLGQDLVYGAARIPSSAALLPAAEIGRLHEVLVDIHEIEAAEARGGLLALRAATPEVLADARKLLEAVEAAANLARELEETGDAWTAELRHKCGQPSYASERQALEALFGEIEELIKARAELLKRPVEIPEAALTTPKAREAITRATETGKPFALFSIGTAEAKEQLAAIRVAGLAPASADDWKHVQRYVLLHEQVLSFSVRWNEFAELLSIPKVRGGLNALRHIELVSVNARKAHQLATQHDAHLPRLAERVFAKPPLQHLKGTSSQLHEVQQHLRSHLTRAELARAATQLATLQEKLAGTSGPISAALRTFVEKELGSPAIPVERIVASYSELVGEVRRIEALAHDIGIVNELAGRIEKAGALKLGARVGRKL